MRDGIVGSFKVKLVIYFVLLSLLPIGAAFWGFTQVAGQSETRRVDARIQSGMRALLASYEDRVNAAQLQATSFARDPTFQRDLEAHDLSSLEQMVRNKPNVWVNSVDGDIVGHPPIFAVTRQATVFSSKGLVGFVTVSVPFDARLVTALRGRSGLGPADSLVILRRGRIVASSPAVAGRVVAPSGQMKTISIGHDRFRSLVAPALADDPDVRFAVLSPQSLIDAANSSSRNKLLLGLIASLALVALVAYFEGRSIVRTLRALAEAAHGIARGRLSERVPIKGRDEFAMLGTAFNDMANQLEARLAELEAERGRLRDAITRFGEALAATHDVNQQLRVIVEAAVEATAAEGARLLADDGTSVETGDPDAGRETLTSDLTAGRDDVRHPDDLRSSRSTTSSGSPRARSPPTRRSRSRTRGCVASSSGRRSSTGSPASRTGDSAKRRSRPRSRAPSGSARRSRSSSPTSTASRRSTTPTGTPSATTSSACSQASCGRPSATPTSPAAGAVRSSSSFCRGPTLRGPASSQTGSGRPSRSGLRSASTGRS